MRRLTPRAVAKAIDKYDPDEATRVQHRVRDDASLDRAVPKLLALYRAVIDQFDRSTVNPEDADAAAAAYLAKLGDFMTAELAPDVQGSSPARKRKPRSQSPG